jgi:hypothetical protein
MLEHPISKTNIIRLKGKKGSNTIVVEKFNILYTNGSSEMNANEEISVLLSYGSNGLNRHSQTIPSNSCETVFSSAHVLYS